MLQSEILNITNMSFNAIHEIQILAKFSEFTVQRNDWFQIIQAMILSKLRLTKLPDLTKNKCTFKKSVHSNYLMNASERSLLVSAGRF